MRITESENSHTEQNYKPTEEKRNHMMSNIKIVTGSGIRRARLSKNYFKGSDLTVTDHEMLRKADITACNADELVDLRKVTVDTEKPSGERTDDYIRQVKNPYLFRIDSTVVKVEFGNGKDFSEILTDAFLQGRIS